MAGETLSPWGILNPKPGTHEQLDEIDDKGTEHTPWGRPAMRSVGFGPPAAQTAGPGEHFSPSGGGMTEQGKSDDDGTRPLAAFRTVWKPSDADFLDELTSPQRAALSVLIVHANGGVAWPSHSTIAQATGFARSTIIQALGELTDMGIISRESDPPKPTRYTVQVLDRPGAGPSRRQTVTVQEVDCDRPGAGHELLIELPNELDTSKSKDAISDMWGIWLEELGGKPPHPTLTTDRKTKLGQLWEEQLRDQNNPLECFRGVLRAIKASEFHMSKRAWQLPESTFGNANKRDTWAIEAKTNGRANRTHMSAAEVEAWDAE